MDVGVLPPAVLQNADKQRSRSIGCNADFLMRLAPYTKLAEFFTWLATPPCIKKAIDILVLSQIYCYFYTY